MAAVFPSLLRATEIPKKPEPTPPDGLSVGPWRFQVTPLRTKTYAAPMPPLSLFAPTMAVLPSALMATEYPNCGVPDPPIPRTLASWWGSH